MKEDKNFVLNKDIPLADGKKIAKGTLITRTHGMYYMEGGLLPADFQKDFDTLITKKRVELHRARKRKDCFWKQQGR